MGVAARNALVILINRKKGTMSTFRDFLVGASKIAVAIVISVVVLSAIGWGIYAMYESNVASKNEPLATPKAWRKIPIESIGDVTVQLRTIWRNSSMSYQFEVDGYPKKIEAALKESYSSGSSDNSFTLVFVDKDDFEVMEHGVLLKEMSRRVDAKGVPGGLSAHGNKYISAEEYRRIADWKIKWRLGQ